MMYMKHIRFAVLALMAFAACAFPLMAADGAESRRAMLSFAAGQVKSLSAREVPATELGEWKELLDASLFLLIRKTEVYRGPIRIMAVSDDSAFARMYPDGTFVASTGLFDYIDRTIFEETAASSRRVRDFDVEREAMLVPFLATEVARFALDQHFASWMYSQGTFLEPDSNACYEADGLAAVLLDLAGYDGNPLHASLNRLRKLWFENAVDISLQDYATTFPSPDLRLDALEKASKDIERITGEFASVLSALRYGTPIKSAQESLAALDERYPASPYIARLAAIAAHMRALEVIPANEQALPVFFPVATVSSGTASPSVAAGVGNRAPFLEIAKTKRASTATAVFSGLPILPGKKPASGNVAALSGAALQAYDKALSLRDEPGLASARAQLLARAGNADSIAAALATAERAALLESGANSFTARANWAILLFLAGSDYAKAQKLVESLSSSVSEPSSPQYLDIGVPGDGRDLVLAHAIMLRLLGDSAVADARSRQASSLFDAKAQTGTIDLRRVKIGDPVDVLTERWGEPASILYDYYSETWSYPSLAATVMVGKKVELVCIARGSPISPGSDLRCGDRRDEFEAAFGASAYRAGDCEVYVKDGNRVSVLYLAGRIRFMTFGL